MKTRNLKGITTPVLVVVFTIIYFFLGKFGLSLTSVNVNASAVCQPTGIALAAMLIWGCRFWPVIFIASFLFNSSTHHPWLASFGIATGNTLEALVATGLVRKFANGLNCFEHARTTFRFFLFAPIFSTLFSATFGVISLGLVHRAGWDHCWSVWSTWWIGNMTSDLVITPFLIIWINARWLRWQAGRMLEGAALLLTLVLVGRLVFLGAIPDAAIEQLECLAFPPLLWAIFRFGLRGATAAVFVITAFAFWSTLHGMGPFTTSDLNKSLLLFQFFTAIISVIGLLLAAAIAERKRAEMALRASEERYRLVLEDQTEAISRFTSDGTLTYVNEVYCRLFARTKPELIGSKWHPRAVKEDLPMIEDQLRKLSPASPVVVIENRIFNGVEEVRWFQFVNRAFFDAAGVLVETQSVGRDITEAKNAEAQLMELAAIVQSSEDAIISITPAEIIISWNRAAERLFGYASEEMIGKNVLVIVPPDQLEKARQIIRRVTLGESVESYETVRRHKDGTLRELSVKASGITDAGGKIISIAVIYRDITERKQLEKMVLEISADERRRIGHELHDGLGQYLAGIAFKAKVLEGDLAAESSRLVRDAEKIVSLINDAIHQTRDLARGFDPVDFEVSGLPAALQNLAAQTENLFHVECAFHCNEERLTLDTQTNLTLYRIAQEAINNAIKHGQARRIEIELKAGKPQLSLTIRDHGKGFLPDARPRLGMGLRIMGYRANMVGGILSVHSEMDVGTEIKCLLPGI